MGGRRRSCIRGWNLGNNVLVNGAIGSRWKIHRKVWQKSAPPIHSNRFAGLRWRREISNAYIRELPHKSPVYGHCVRSATHYTAERETIVFSSVTTSPWKTRLVVAFTLLLAALSLSRRQISLKQHSPPLYSHSPEGYGTNSWTRGQPFLLFLFSFSSKNLKRLDRQSIIRWVAPVSDTLPPTTPTPTGPFSPENMKKKNKKSRVYFVESNLYRQLL